MQDNSTPPAEAARQPGADELQDLQKRRADLLPKMAGMLKRNAPIEISNTACHVCGRRFSLRLEVEGKGRSEDAGVFRIHMACKHCQWNVVFYGYLHRDGRYGLDGRQRSADRFFDERR